MTLPHKLPAEILQHIFHLRCTLSYRWYLDTHPRRKQFGNSPVLLLLQVCSRWRQLLLHAPMFWDFVQTSSDPSQLSLASLWLSHAGLRPRTLGIMHYGPSPAAPIQSLIAQFPFSSLELDIRNDAEKLEFSEIPTESLLPLKVLVLSNEKSDSSQLSLGHHSFPNLSELYMCWYFDSLSTLVTSKTIQKLWIDKPIPISLCLEILRSATNLREILHLMVDDAKTVASIQDVVAPNLTDVGLYFEYGCSSAGPLFRALTAPNLKHLQIHMMTPNKRLTCDASSFLPKAGQFRMPKLENLSIARTMRPVDIGILLRSIPSLRILIVESKAILDENTMQGLESGKLGPRLWKMYPKTSAYLTIPSEF
jgi:hypothetical protein